MPGLLQDLLKSEFVIDESREEVWEEVLNDSKLRWVSDDKQEIENKENEDLFTQISSMLQEQERLENLAEELKKTEAKPGEEKFKHFFRTALAVLDGFDRVMRVADEQPPSEELQNWLKSISSIQGRVDSLFERFGLRTMDPVGKEVDLDRHEVVEVIKMDSIPDETVVEVRQRGYILDGKVLRDAKVVVAKMDI